MPEFVEVKTPTSTVDFTTPMITQTLSGFVFEWISEADFMVTVEVKHIRTDSHHTTYGDITVKSIDKEHPILSNVRLNLTSQKARTEISKRLGELWKTIIWDSKIELVCRECIDRQLSGEPAQELWTSEDIPPLEYLLEPIIIKGVPTIIFGEKGVAKSTLSLIFYTCLLLPEFAPTIGLNTPTHKANTLILDYELPGYIAQRNAKSIQEGMNLPPFPLYHRHCTLPLAEDLEQVAFWVEKTQAEVLIIDSLARACGGDLIKTEPANDFFEALDKLKVTSLIIAQTSKDIENKKKSIYGNALFTYYARSIFELCKSEYISGNEIDVALFHRFSNLTKLYPEMGFSFSFNGHGTVIERKPVNVDEFKDKVSGQVILMQALKGGLKTVDELTEITGWQENSVRVLLSKLKKRGRIKDFERGKWGAIDNVSS